MISKAQEIFIHQIGGTTTCPVCNGLGVVCDGGICSKCCQRCHGSGTIRLPDSELLRDRKGVK